LSSDGSDGLQVSPSSDGSQDDSDIRQEPDTDMSEHVKYS